MTPWSRKSNEWFWRALTWRMEKMSEILAVFLAFSDYWIFNAQKKINAFQNMSSVQLKICPLNNRRKKSIWWLWRKRICVSRCFKTKRSLCNRRSNGTLMKRTQKSVLYPFLQDKGKSFDWDLDVKNQAYVLRKTQSFKIDSNQY